ncbi:MAG: DUF4040 domain-containing protein [Symploca sp. SIO1A3]|nr:DUF4040 domain-containing protein [Symploca sp. SIO2C1]NER51668.1 DUF4040 domain-containing protein [Symploca sp. SIO1A3]
MMSEDLYIIAITALLPLTACMVVLQVNPYHALVIRGIFGAVAALVYALFGAADVGLTEALVGTMLSITLYAVAVRSSLTMRVGVLESELNPEPSERVREKKVGEMSKKTLRQGDKEMQRMEITTEISLTPPESNHPSEELLSALRKTLSKYHLRLEQISYTNPQALQTALTAKEIHTTLSEQWIAWESLPLPSTDDGSLYHIQTRIPRLYEIMQSELPSTLASLTYVNSETLSQPQINHSIPNG